MKYARLLLCCAGLSLGVAALARDKTELERVPAASFTDQWQQGIRAYNRKDYTRAFPLLERMACAGDKTSQLLVGRMYILSQGTEKDDLKGYAWIKTAAEFRFRDFTSLAHQLEQALDPQQRKDGNALAQKYRQHYGLVATRMDCRGAARHGAKIVDSVVCSPQSAGGSDVWLQSCLSDASR